MLRSLTILLGQMVTNGTRLSTASSGPRRSFGSHNTGGGRNKNNKNNHDTKNNPLNKTTAFRILGVPPHSSFDTVQKAFVKLALQNHPDTAEHATTESFVRIRHAFERIRDGDKKNKKHTPFSRSENDETRTTDNTYKTAPHQQHPGDIDRADWTEDDFLDWFHDQTGQRVSSAQRRELIELHRSRVPGAVYQGSMWELARRLAQEQDAFLLKQQQQQQQQQQNRGQSSFYSTTSSRTTHQHSRTGDKQDQETKTGPDGSGTVRRKRQR
jgi:curved DNA-binding protein CbpA